MLKASWMMLLTIGSLLSANGFADDAKSSTDADESLTLESLSLEMLLEESKYGSRWQLQDSGGETLYSDNWPQPIAEFDFRDGSALARVIKLRSLSLLTLAEFGPARLFLGVNDDGLVGLHFNDVLRNDDERYLEMARMPYLEENKLDSGVERLAREDN